MPTETMKYEWPRVAPHKVGLNKDRVTLFLDIDGVFNSDVYTRKLWAMKKESGVEVPYPYNSFDPIAVENFNRLYRTVGDQFNVVISSSWRVDSNLPKLWEQAGFLYPYDDITPYKPDKCRGDEIVEYIKEHGMEDGYYMIIDDDMDAGDESNADYLGGCWYQVDPRFGITSVFVDEMLCRINRAETDGNMLDTAIANEIRRQYVADDGPMLMSLGKQWLGVDIDPREDNINLQRLRVFYDFDDL